MEFGRRRPSVTSGPRRGSVDQGTGERRSIDMSNMNHSVRAASRARVARVHDYDMGPGCTPDTCMRPTQALAACHAHALPCIAHRSTSGCTAR